MDELKDAWNRINSSEDFEPLTKEEILKSIHQKSKGITERLTKKVFYKFIICLFFTVLIGLAIPFIEPVVSQWLLSVLLIAYVGGTILLYKEHKYLKNQVLMDQDLLSHLKSFQKRINDIVLYEELIGLILYPISAAGGYLVGLRLGNPALELLKYPKDWFIFIFVVILIVPIGHFTTKFLNRITFRKFLKQLQSNISELENEETYL